MPTPPVGLSPSAEGVGDCCPTPLQSLLPGMLVAGSSRVGKGHHPSFCRLGWFVQMCVLGEWTEKHPRNLFPDLQSLDR